ncbi:MAG: Multidrug export protein MepA [Gemmatimonadaceae bacterium]|nr:Multidrug export protein MepA [Gemmatimonadaceae bacterium]
MLRRDDETLTFLPEPEGTGSPGAAAAPLTFPVASPVAADGAIEVDVAPLRGPGITADALPAVVRRIAIPAVVSNLLMTLFASADAYWVGTHLGSQALAAVSTSVFWIWVVVSIGEMVSVGLTAVASRRHGERDSLAAAAAVGVSLRFALILGAALGIIGALGVDWLFTLMRTPPEVTALGRDYLRTYLLGLPFIFGYFAVDAAFRAAGDTRTPLALLLVSVVCTLVLDPVLILGLWGVPPLGIAGAAVALTATRGSAFFIGAAILIRRGMIARGASRSTIASVVRVGLPTAATGVLFSLIYVLMTRTTTTFGTSALAALGVGHRVESWLYMVGVGFGAGGAAIVGQNLGARRFDRASRAGWITMSYAMLPALLLCTASLTVPEWMASRFSHDPAVIAETARYLRINAFAQLLLPAEIVLEGALGGAGDTLPPMLTSTALTAFRIPLAAWSAARWGTTGIWWTIALTAAARGVAMMLLWRSGRWQRKSL